MTTPVLWLVHRPDRKLGLAFAAHCGPQDYQGPSWEIALDAIVGFGDWLRVIVCGWGYDPEVPLRPWPQVWLDRVTKRENVTSGFALCGFFLTVGHTPDKKVAQ